MLTTTTDDVHGITPDTIDSLIVLPVQRGSVAMQVSTIISTPSTRTHIPLVAADPTVGWVAEGDEISPHDPTVDDIVIVPAKVAGLSIITNELAADSSPAAASQVGDGLARKLIVNIDNAFFGSHGVSAVQPHGLEDLVGVNPVDAGDAWANLDAFAEAIGDADGYGLDLGAFVANPADALLLAKLKDQTGSNRPLLGTDPSAPTKRIILGVPLLTSPGVTAGTVWGIPKSRSLIVQRQNVELAVDKSAYFTSDRTAIRATMRVGFGFPHPAAIQKITLSDD